MATRKAAAKPNVSAEELLGHYREMLLIRRFEEKAGQLTAWASSAGSATSTSDRKLSL